MDDIVKVTCVVKGWDPTLKYNLKKLHGTGVAREQGLPESHPLAQTSLYLGSDPLEGIGALYRMVAGMDARDREALGRIQIDFERE